jgi:putative tricarboxylic transport membrane protein
MIFLFRYSYSFPTLAIGGKLGPGFWPRLSLTIGMVLTIISGYQAIVKSKLPEANEEDDKDTVSPGVSQSDKLGRFLVSAVAFLVFVLLVQRIGFMVSAPFFVAFYMWQLGIKRVPVLVIGSIGITAAFVLLFGRFLYVALPRGTGALRVLSYYIY